MKEPERDEDLGPGRPIDDRRKKLMSQFHLTYKQVRNMKESFLDQMNACKSNAAQRILLRARSEGHQWRKKNQPSKRAGG